MKQYTELEKQKIILFSDLLDIPLEKNEIASLLEFVQESEGDILSWDSKLNVNLYDKVKQKLGKGIQLGFELEQLAQRGIEVVFIYDIPQFFKSKLDDAPQLLFVSGNQNILSSTSATIIFDDKELNKYHNEEIILLSELALSKLIIKQPIRKKLTNNHLLIFTYCYRNTKKKIKKKKVNTEVNTEVKNSKQKIFISGSRSQTIIPKNVQDSIEKIKNNEMIILIGDSDKGVDNEIIDYLRLPLYEKVEIYTIKKEARVKVETSWNSNIVEFTSTLKPQAQQMQKDRKMADEADFGLAIFNPITINRYGSIQISSGTLRNSIQLLLNNKPVKFFYKFENKMCVENLKTINDLQNILNQYKTECIDMEETKLILSAKGIKTDNAAIVKHYKIMVKYKELLKNEQNQYVSQDNTNHDITNSHSKEKQLTIF